MTESTTGISRRTLVKGAAWSVPVLAVAAATPMAAASLNNANVRWDGTRSSLASISLLAGGSVNANVAALPSVPNSVLLENGAGALSGPITGVIAITHASGIPAGLSLSGDATARGFAVSSIPGVTLGTRTITQKHLVNLTIGVPPLAITVAVGVDETSQAFTLNTASVAENATEILGAITYALTNRSLLGIGVLMTFNVAVTLYAPGSQVIASTAMDVITVPIGAGVL